MIKYKNSGPAGPDYGSLQVSTVEDDRTMLCFVIIDDDNARADLHLDTEQLTHLCDRITEFLNRYPKSAVTVQKIVGNSFED